MREFKPLPLNVSAGDKVLHAVSWKESIESLLDSEKAPTDQIAIKKRHRVATSDAGHMSDWMMKVCANIGWGTFAGDKDKDQPIYLRPRVTASWDSGPDMLCLTMYLQNFKKRRMTTIFSILHGAQRAMWGGVKENNKNGVLIIGCVIANMPRGHFEGESVRVMLQESCVDYKGKTDETDALLNFLGPKSLRDKGIDPMSWNEAYAAETHEQVDKQKWIQQKPPKVALT